MSLDYSTSFNLVPVETKKKKIKRRVENLGYDKSDTELKALIERRKFLLKQKLTNEKKSNLKKEINNLENKPNLRNKIANFLSPQANSKRKEYFKAHKIKTGGMDSLNKALKPLMDL